MVPCYAKKAEITKKTGPHSLRHTTAAHLLDRGMDLRYVQSFLRHADISFTRIYTPASTRRLRQKLAFRHTDNLKVRTSKRSSPSPLQSIFKN